MAIDQLEFRKLYAECKSRGKDFHVYNIPSNIKLTILYVANHSVIARDRHGNDAGYDISQILENYRIAVLKEENIRTIDIKTDCNFYLGKRGLFALALKGSEEDENLVAYSNYERIEMT